MAAFGPELTFDIKAANGSFKLKVTSAERCKSALGSQAQLNRGRRCLSKVGRSLDFTPLETSRLSYRFHARFA